MCIGWVAALQFLTSSNELSAGWVVCQRAQENMQINMTSKSNMHHQSNNKWINMDNLQNMLKYMQNDWQNNMQNNNV